VHETEMFFKRSGVSISIFYTYFYRYFHRLHSFVSYLSQGHTNANSGNIMLPENPVAHP
jgi:hypothetical protein